MDFLFAFGAQEILLILLVVLILFGGKKLPELMRGAGRGIREFKDALNTSTDLNEEKNEKTNEEKK